MQIQWWLLCSAPQKKNMCTQQGEWVRVAPGQTAKKSWITRGRMHKWHINSCGVTLGETRRKVKTYTEPMGVETKQNHTYAVSWTKPKPSHTHTHTHQADEKESKMSSVARGWRERGRESGVLWVRWVNPDFTSKQMFNLRCDYVTVNTHSLLMETDITQVHPFKAFVISHN